MMTENPLFVENVWVRIVTALGITAAMMFGIPFSLLLLKWISVGQVALPNAQAWQKVICGPGMWVIFFLLFLGALCAHGERSSEASVKPKGNLNIVIEHPLAQEEALKRIKTVLADAKEKHGDQIQALQETWNESGAAFRITARGYAILGTIRVGPRQVEIDANIPFPASLAKGKIESFIRGRAEALLNG